MINSIRIRELNQLSAIERTTRLNGLVAEAKAPINGQAVTIKEKIDGYETKFGLTSAQLGDRLRSNSIRETPDVADWLFWLNVRKYSGG